MFGLSAATFGIPSVSSNSATICRWCAATQVDTEVFRSAACGTNNASTRSPVPANRISTLLYSELDQNPDRRNNWQHRIERSRRRPGGDVDAGRIEPDVAVVEHVDDLREERQAAPRPVERPVGAQIEAAVCREPRPVPHLADEI